MRAPDPRPRRLTACEFFAGGGLARLGLDAAFETVFANDLDPMKAEAYRANFGAGELVEGDVSRLTAADVPGRPDLAWASFPCQDLSLAGARGGLASPRSGTFFAFARLIEALRAEGRAPPALCLENVSGLLSSRGGADFAAVLETLDALGYRAGALEIDAAAFTPQSRPRVFVVAVARDRPIDPALIAPPGSPVRASIAQAVARLPDALRAAHVAWAAPAPPARNAALVDLLDADACCWWSAEKTERLLAQLHPRQRARLDALAARTHAEGGRAVVPVYRRMRVEDGAKVQRAEARFDGLAGCLRTPSGGSSRQFLLVMEAGALRARTLTAREAMRLMGAPDDYVLPRAETAGLKIAGDGVCVPLVAHLARTLLAPLARGADAARRAA